MSKIAVVYWSQTGNTEAMAEAVAAGIQEKGAEVLEESEFQPMFDSCESKLGGKKIALFGSCGWGGSGCCMQSAWCGLGIRNRQK